MAIRNRFLLLLGVLLLSITHQYAAAHAITRRQDESGPVRQRASINKGWKFQRSTTNPDSLSYDSLKAWILPSGNEFLDGSQRHDVPPGARPGGDVRFAQASFDDGTWEAVDLPHDWAIKGPFETGPGAVGAGMGRLPSHGVAWYRRVLQVPEADVGGKTFYLDVDGAMSYAMVWLNGKLVGGWPYGYNSFRLDLTPYVEAGDNQLAIRLDNARDNSRWYPGGGIYRNVWLTTVDHVHVPQYGTYITSSDVSAASASLALSVRVRDSSPSAADREVTVNTDIHVFDKATRQAGEKVASFPASTMTFSQAGGETRTANVSLTMQDPKLWGPAPSQIPNMYVAVTKVSAGGKLVDTYETRFGIRSMTYTPDGLLVNGQAVELNGVCLHHDQGALGAAFHFRAEQRRFETLQRMGTNAVRTSHNPPSPDLLDLADEMGILILDEIFDAWQSRKTSNDFSRIFNDWHEADLRSFLRRDRNHPSIFGWSYGNEVGEQRSASGGSIAQALQDIVHQEDPTRRCTAGMNSAGPGDAISRVVEMIGLNYQGEGIGGGQPTFPSFHSRFPDKMVFSTESSSAVSSRGTFLFPVIAGDNAAVSDRAGGDGRAMQISDYGLYSVQWGASPDRVFAAQERNAYAAGQFVWTGTDYVGETTPYDGARSSYFGIIDLAGFPKERFYLYQQQWRPDYATAHITPHWTWPGRVGQVTPVHVFSAADEAELFLNGESLGKQRREPQTYRFRWDTVKYAPGELSVVTFKSGSSDVWANATVRTTGAATKLRLRPDRDTLVQGLVTDDLSFVTAEVVDANGDVVPVASDAISFSVSGPGEIVATDNGDPTDMAAFPSTDRKAFRGLALVIVRPAKDGATGLVNVTATADGLETAQVTLRIE